MLTFGALRRYIRDNGGICAASLKVTRLSWMLLRKSGVRSLLSEVKNTLQIRRAQVVLLGRREKLANLARKKEIAILATPHTMYVAYMLSFGLSQTGFRVSIVTSPPAMGFGQEIYIVICPQMFAQLPVNMIAFQMEQSTSARWFTRSYLEKLRTALAILDYSKTNIEFLTQQGISFGNIFYLPITPVPGYLNFLSARGFDIDHSGGKTCDVLFYGDANNERRRVILGKLGERFKVEIVTNLFGPKLYKKLLNARVVLNIHYYEDALLETTRISECLSLGIPVVSESSADRKEYPELESRIHFVDVGDVAAMIETIESILRVGDACPNREVRPDQVLDAAGTASSFYLNRFLLAYGLIDLETFSRGDPLPPRFGTGKICLSLPETVARRAFFLSQGLTAYETFDGLRNAQGWIGCGLSYKYLLQRAKMARIARVLICEDDVVLTAKSEAALAVVDEYLDSLDDDWDIFVGLIAHLHPDMKVSRVSEFKGLTFVHLDKMTSTVLNIYNHSIYDVLISWNETNEDPKTNTIDRYLESREKLRVVTAVPFIVGHSEGGSSTLWGFGNEQYVEWIARSQDLLQERVKAFSVAE